MMFSAEQKTELAKPLNAANVKKRAQAGRQLCYIESWKAIDEANRIFGFDAWTSATLDVKCVAEKEREIGTNKAPGWGVSYTARVRVTVGEIARDGVGAGHGIDRDLGQAHESAIKEAESDARKRALMTFGYPFGLALYDKEQEHVATESQKVTPIKSNLLSEPAASETQARLVEEIKGCVSIPELEKFIASDGFKHRVGALPDKHRGYVRMAFKDRGAELKARAA